MQRHHALKHAWFFCSFDHGILHLW